MKARTLLEPGVLSTFRTFTGVRVVVVGLVVLMQFLLHGFSRFPHVVFFMFGFAEGLLLFFYLSWRTPQRWLGRFYLPLGILWAALGPMLELHVSIWLNGSLSENVLLLAAWQLIPVLFIPLVIVAWQYSFRAVLFFCGLTALVDLGPFVNLKLQDMLPAFPMPVVGVVLIRSVIFLFMGNMIAKIMKIQREQRRALTEANARLELHATTLEELTVSRERNRLAREMHDVLAHTLSSVAVELEAVRALWEMDPPKAQSLLAHSLETTREGLTETRRAMQELRAAPLEVLGLGPAVSSLAEAAASRAGLHLDLAVDAALGDFPAPVQQCVYRVAQEALSNIIRHAGAQTIHLNLHQQQGRLELIITDDGRGLAPDDASDPDHLGLLGMRERAEMIGGALTVESCPGQGTKVSLTWG